jgi:hypothetical protein
MRWRKLGRVRITGAPRGPKRLHASRPTPHGLHEQTIRVYVALFDEDGVARIGFVDVAADDPRRVLQVSDDPALDVGEVGAFDEHGVTPSAVIAEGPLLRLYYSGWQRAIKVPGLSFAGLAISADGGTTFERVSRAPILPRIDGERVRRSEVAVVRADGSWRAWYVAADSWLELDGELVPKGEIRTAASEDGLHWRGGADVAVELLDNDELGVDRPIVSLTDQANSIWAAEAESVTVRLGGVFSTPSATYLFYDTGTSGESGFDLAALELGFYGVPPG